MRHSTWQHLFVPVLFVSLFLASCGKDNPTPTPAPPAPDPGTSTEVPLKTQRINRFIVAAMQDRYLWNSGLPSEIDITSESDPAALFKRLRNPQDSWSVLSDNVQQTQGEFTNETRSYGFELSFGKFNNSENMFAVVLFTYPGSPAAKAGIKRGDIFMRVNNMDITMNTYTNFYRFPNVSLQYGHLEGNTIYLASKTVTLTGTEMYLDPVIDYSVIDRAGHKIGYLCYSGFVSKSIGRLEEVFSTFQQQQVTDIILDLRYNPGGEVSTMAKLCSMLAPKSAVESHSVLQTRIYNKEYTEYLKQTGTDVNDYFDPSVAVNLNGLPLYTLTESGTASASESLILCLKPYMSVKQVGSSTAGKYCGGSLLQPAVQQGGQLVPDPEIGNWLLYLMMFKIADVHGQTISPSGLYPDIWASSLTLPELKLPLGDPLDPFMAKAIASITGQPVPARIETKSASPEFTLLPELTGKTGTLSAMLIDSTVMIPVVSASH